MIQFSYSGIKQDGVFFKGIWYWGNITSSDKKVITFYATGYAPLPEKIRSFFSVENETDAKTDYFEGDKFRVEQSHPLFKRVAPEMIKTIQHQYASFDRSRKAAHSGTEIKRCFDHMEACEKKIDELKKIMEA